MKKKTPHRVKLAQNLRKASTDAENFLWRYLRAKQLAGLKFRRQEPIENYIVDFACFERRLVIEVDGGQHAARKLEDRKRDGHLKSSGFKVLRFWNNEILTNIEGVLLVIGGFAGQAPSPHSPPVEGGDVDEDSF